MCKKLIKNKILIKIIYTMKRPKGMRRRHKKKRLRRLKRMRRKLKKKKIK